MQGGTPVAAVVGVDLWERRDEGVAREHWLVVRLAGELRQRTIESYARTLLLDHLKQKVSIFVRSVGPALPLLLTSKQQEPAARCRRDGPIERFSGKESHLRQSLPLIGDANAEES